jgi:signal peptidase I
MARVTRKTVEIGAVAFIAAFFVALPIYAGTGTYPIAIVQGNSMYPTLHNGDVVIFKAAPHTMIANNTIIVFVQGETGVSALDSIIRPVVIHRVVGTVVQADGTVYYRTKGDNNQYPDPSLTQASNVLGTPMEVVPGVGVIILFFESPQGLVALIGMISLYYVGRYEVFLSEDRRREKFLAALGQLVLDGDLSLEQFKRMEIVVKYGKAIQTESLDDPLTAAVADWVKKGNLAEDWKLSRSDCHTCTRLVTSFVSKGSVLTICPRCSARKVQAPPVPEEQERSKN